MVAENEGEISEAGIYTWFLASDRVFGDTLVAELFGLKAEDTIRGLPLRAFTDRIHPNDQDEAKRLISKAVIDGEPYYAEYRVIDTLKQSRLVVALGRCFRDERGMPFIYSGIIYPIDRLEA